MTMSVTDRRIWRAGRLTTSEAAARVTACVSATFAIGALAGTVDIAAADTFLHRGSVCIYAPAPAMSVQSRLALLLMNLAASATAP